MQWLILLISLSISMPSTPIKDSAMAALKAQMDSGEYQSSPASPKKKGVSKMAYAAPVIGAAADLGSTAYAMDHGAHEANPLMGDGMGKMIAMKGASTLAILGLMKMLSKDHPKLASGLGYGTGIGQGVVAAHNIAQVKK